MARFDVYEYKSMSVPVVLDMQADLLSDFVTCVVVPLIPEFTARKEIASKLKPVIQIREENYILMTTDMAAIKRKSLGNFVENIEKEHRQDVIEANDFLFQGL
ncbi:CcdB family protein [Nitrosomonas aestuarii]|uniref:CcdB family protein n=1 Tax=Nitrosomonas aestuarii TaxID=52441 RepID=UPI000D4C9D53|nr:CcdB family protein [Nitrosomonas aestuarii]PTN08261.1 toxin CcdB [Nitrosomonas aestuarii]